MTTADSEPRLEGRAVFLSASIPNPGRWHGYFDALEITDAVVAVARAILSAGGVLVTAAHPTIAPLILYVAAELPQRNERSVLVYQSAVFDEVLPAATRRFEAEGVGAIIRTPKIANEPADPTKAPQSLATMRSQMLTETEPAAAVFIGGMAGIPDEYRLFSELYPGRPIYPLGFPGGEARTLGQASQSRLGDQLNNGSVYPTLARAIVGDIVDSMG
ncbi:SLOG domain-containing protein [Williamsia muralis]|uniref:Uncharacterized protein n=1 Tax=Williamsia marianensis TaxID=85044 RepID=A0ABU4F0P1_WILMA|nr:hypothetical protein [Williamsia muralis]MDV7137073.1 hypothetical protein [Williamsia muralis]